MPPLENCGAGRGRDAGDGDGGHERILGESGEDLIRDAEHDSQRRGEAGGCGTVDMLGCEKYRDRGVRGISGSILDAELPREHFDGVFVSNMLEHLPSQDAAGEIPDSQWPTEPSTDTAIRRHRRDD